MSELQPYHLVSVTIYGDEWERDEYHVVRTEKEAIYFLTDYKEKELNVGGVHAVDVDCKYNISINELCVVLRVDELIKAIPELESEIVAKLLAYTGGFRDDDSN